MPLLHVRSDHGLSSSVSKEIRRMLPHRVRPSQDEPQSWEHLATWACEWVKSEEDFKQARKGIGWVPAQMDVCTHLTECDSVSACQKSTKLLKARTGRHTRRVAQEARALCNRIYRRGPPPRPSCHFAPAGISQMHDAWAFLNFFANTTRGTFFEMGAEDGLTGSLSYFFERSLGWTGILVEPQPHSFRRVLKNRPRSSSMKVQKCVHPSHRWVEFRTNGPMGGIVDSSEEGQWLRRRNDQAGSSSTWLQAKTVNKFFRSESVNVSCATLDEILLAHAGIRERGVDWFSLDVEGFELPVLQSFSWSVPLHVVTIENNIKNREIDDLLSSHGFQYFADYQTNNIWVNCSWWKRC